MRRLLSLTLMVAALAGAQGDHSARLAELDSLALRYAMQAEYDKAAEAVREMLSLNGNQPATQLRLGRLYSYQGRTGAAIGMYDLYLKAEAEDRAASIEMIRLLRYRGDYTRAEQTCDMLLARNHKDAEALALKAEVLHWAGNRRRMAGQAAERAVELAPDSPDARVSQVYTLLDQGRNRDALHAFQALESQVARLGGVTPQSTYGDAYKYLDTDLVGPMRRSTLVPQNRPAYSVYNDSDGIHNVFTGLQLAAPFRQDHKLRLNLGHYRSSAPLGGMFTAGRSRSQRSEFSAGGAFRAASSVHMTLLGGGSGRATGGQMRPTFDLHLAAAPLDRWSFEFGSGRQFLPVTPRAIDLDISSYQMNAGASYALDPRTSVGLRAERRWWSDDNRSWAGELVANRILHYYKPLMVDAGALTRWESFERDSRFASGFFTPDLYRRHDGFVGVHGEIKGWFLYEIRGSLGAQQTARHAGYRSSWEFASAATLRLTRSLGLHAGYQRRNYSLISRTGWYHGFAVSLGIQP